MNTCSASSVLFVLASRGRCLLHCLQTRHHTAPEWLSPACRFRCAQSRCFRTKNSSWTYKFVLFRSFCLTDMFSKASSNAENKRMALLSTALISLRFTLLRWPEYFYINNKKIFKVLIFKLNDLVFTHTSLYSITFDRVTILRCYTHERLKVWKLLFTFIVSLLII